MCWSLVSRPRLLLAYPMCGLYIREEWQQRVPFGKLRSSSFTFEPGPSAGQGIGFSQTFVRDRVYSRIHLSQPASPSPPFQAPRADYFALGPFLFSICSCETEQTKLYLEKPKLVTYAHSHDFFLLCPPFVVS